MSVRNLKPRWLCFDLENIALGAHDADFRVDIARCSSVCCSRANRGQESYCDFEPTRRLSAGCTKRRSSSSRSACAQSAKIPRHPHGRRCARSLLHQESRRHLRHHKRRSDFSAEQMRENDKTVIGVGVKSPRRSITATATNLSITTISCAWSSKEAAERCRDRASSENW